MMDEMMEILRELLAIDSPTGYTRRAAGWVKEKLESWGFAPQMTNKGCLCCCLGGEGDPVIVSAHLDTLGGMVAGIKENGRLRITNLGGLNAHNCECENCRIYTRGGAVYEGTLQMNDPSIHVNGDYHTQERSFDTMEVVIDEPVKNREETKALGIETGDVVCFDPRTRFTESGYIKSRFLDDKLSVAILLSLAHRVAEGEVTLRRRVYLFITVYEEVGHGASGALPAGAREILSVDMGCVGQGLACDERMVSICVKDSRGPYDYQVTGELIRCARENGIAYAADVYPHYGSDADAALAAGYDLRHGLIGAGVYASHGYERAHRDGAENTLRLLCAYLGA